MENYDYELAPHLIELMIGESAWKIENCQHMKQFMNHQAFLTEIALCSFYIGRKSGVTTAIKEYARRNDNIIIVAHNTDHAKNFVNISSEIDVYSVNTRSYDYVGRILKNECILIFDTCTRKQISDFLARIPNTDNIKSLVLCGEISNV